MMKKNPLTYCMVDQKAIRDNLRAIRRVGRLRKTGILSVIKADAYGHGMVEVGKIIQREGVDLIGVSDVAEGVRLRTGGVKKPILLFESTLAAFAPQIIKHKLTPTVCTLDLAKALNAKAERIRKRISVHVKVDTGMNRLGVRYSEAVDFIEQLMKLTWLKIEGLYTHFPSADTNAEFTRKQLKKLDQLVRALDQKGLVLKYVHAANSAGLIGYKSKTLNLARPGLLLYGLYPSQKFRSKIRLKPALSVHSTIILLKDLQKGEGVSYGRTFKAKKKMRIAVVPIGYNDGYFRAFSNKAFVLIAGKRCPVIGNVTMDQIIVDVSSVKNPRLGAPVVVLGVQKRKSISADDLAKLSKTINYEIVCALGNRLPRIFK